MILPRIRGFLHYCLFKMIYKKINPKIYIGKYVTIEGKKNISIGKNFKITNGAVLTPTDLTIGNNCSVNFHSVLLGKIRIGNGVRIGPNTLIAGADHVYESSTPVYKSGMSIKGIWIGDNVWIGGNVSILDGIKIGSNTVIGAGTVVKRDVPENSIVIGIPGKSHIRE